MDSRTSATISWLSLRHRSYSAYSRRHGEYQTEGGIGRRGIDLRSRLLVSSSTRLTLGDCMLAVDNVARSSTLAAILCLTLCKIALPLRRTLATAHKMKCLLAFIPRCQHSVPCKLQLPFLSPASPSSVRRTSTTRLTVLSKLSTGLPYIYLGHLADERRCRRCSLETIANTAVDAGRRSGERECGAPTVVRGLRRTSRCCIHRRPDVGSYLSDTTRLRRDEWKSGLSSHHELDAHVDEPYHYCLFCVEYLNLE